MINSSRHSICHSSPGSSCFLTKAGSKVLPRFFAWRVGEIRTVSCASTRCGSPYKASAPKPVRVADGVADDQAFRAQYGAWHEELPAHVGHTRYQTPGVRVKQRASGGGHAVIEVGHVS